MHSPIIVFGHFYTLIKVNLYLDDQYFQKTCDLLRAENLANCRVMGSWKIKCQWSDQFTTCTCGLRTVRMQVYWNIIGRSWMIKRTLAYFYNSLHESRTISSLQPKKPPQRCKQTTNKCKTLSNSSIFFEVAPIRAKNYKRERVRAVWNSPYASHHRLIAETKWFFCSSPFTHTKKNTKPTKSLFSSRTCFFLGGGSPRSLRCDSSTSGRN